MRFHATVSSIVIFVVCSIFVYFTGSYINSVNAAVSSKTHYNTSVRDDAKVTENASKIRYITRNVLEIFRNNHYRKQNLNEDFNTRFFEKYIDMLDPERIYFTVEDVDKFKEQSSKLVAQLERGNADFAFMVYDVYKQRMQEYRDYAEKLLVKDFDYTKDEYIIPDRSEKNRPANIEEMHELWRKRLKNDVLNLRLYEKMMADNHEKNKNTAEEEKMEKIRMLWRSKEPKVKILNHLKDVVNAVEQRNILDVLDIYLTAFAQIYGPHSSYLSPKSNEDFDIRMSLSLSGIGATLTSEDGLIRIVEIIPGGPAALDGRLKVEDRIIGVGQGKEGEMVDVVNMSVSNAVKLIRGKENSIVRLAILPGSEGRSAKPRIIEIVRKRVVLTEAGAKGSVKTVGSGSAQKKIGVIYIPSFYMDFDAAVKGDTNYRSLTRDVDKILKDFNSQNVDAVVIDLRGNGGGSLMEAIKLSGLFIKSGPVVQIRDSRGRLNVRDDDDNDYIAYRGPLVILNSRMSASASEIFSGAMRDHNRAVIVGDSSSFGKGTVLEVINLNDLFSLIPITFKAGSLQYESAVFYRVTGSSVQQLGINSDIVIPSFSEVLEIGERFSKNHLPWDEIDGRKITGYYENFDEILKKLKAGSDIRVKNNKFFTGIKQEQEIFKKHQKENRRSLNEEKRYKEYFTEKKMLDEARRSLNDVEKKKNNTDGVLSEAVNIAADFAEIVKK